jgi:hypothetical protein
MTSRHHRQKLDAVAVSKQLGCDLKRHEVPVLVA